MKYAIVIMDGAADKPLDELDGQTPFEAAHTPNLDAIAKSARLGTAATTPEGFAAGSDVCSMSLLGYDPSRYHTGRAPLEAAALGLDLAGTDWIFRLNFVTVGEPGAEDDGLMLDHSAGAISNAEARELVSGLVAFWNERLAEVARGFKLFPGVSYRNILVDTSGASGIMRAYDAVVTTPPHEIPREPWAEHLPAAKGGDESGEQAAGVLRSLIEATREFLAEHPVNVSRRAKGQRAANLAWIWGQGVKPAMPSFESRFALRGAMITAVDLLAGIAALMGWERLDVPGVTSYHDTDYAAQGRATCDALDAFDIICCHVESPDEASHQADWQTKVAAIEAIDTHVIGPIVRKLQTFGDPEQNAGAEGWRLLVMPDHYTLVSTRKHDATPPPVLIAGSWVRTVIAHERFTEAACDAGDLHIDHGHELMEYFLRGGLAQVKTRVSRAR